MHQEDGPWRQIIHDCGADLVGSQCTAPIAGINGPADRILIAHAGDGRQDAVVCFTHRSAEVRTRGCTACAVLHQ